MLKEREKCGSSDLHPSFSLPFAWTPSVELWLTGSLTVVDQQRRLAAKTNEMYDKFKAELTQRSLPVREQFGIRAKDPQVSPTRERDYR